MIDKFLVWPEGQPNQAQFAIPWWHMQLLMFSMGLRTMFPNPLKARRMICAGNNLIAPSLSAIDNAMIIEHAIT